MIFGGQHSVLIIGAGPAGLAAGHCLKNYGIDFRILEAGPEPLHSFKKIDRRMRLLSPARFSILPGLQYRGRVDTYMTFADYIAELQAYAEPLLQRIAVGCRVISARPHRSGLQVIWEDENRGTVQADCRYLINAGGIIGNPRFPENLVLQDCPIPWLHSIDVREHHLKNVRRLLVVGGSASAREVLLKWLEIAGPEKQAWLSLRSSLQAVPNPLLGLDVHFWSWLPEQIPVRFFRRMAEKVREPMLGRRVPRAIRRRRIQKVAAISGFEDGMVNIKNGDSLDPDFIVFATGFDYALEHLDGLLDFYPDGRLKIRDCQSLAMPRLFLLGYRFGRTLASPYLRGIAADARVVARKIVEELK